MITAITLFILKKCLEEGYLHDYYLNIPFMLSVCLDLRILMWKGW